jgi:hypothetical protein
MILIGSPLLAIATRDPTRFTTIQVYPKASMPSSVIG